MPEGRALTAFFERYGLPIRLTMCRTLSGRLSAVRRPHTTLDWCAKLGIDTPQSLARRPVKSIQKALASLVKDCSDDASPEASLEQLQDGRRHAMQQGAAQRKVLLSGSSEV